MRLRAAAAPNCRIQSRDRQAGTLLLLPPLPEAPAPPSRQCGVGGAGTASATLEVPGTAPTSSAMPMSGALLLLLRATASPLQAKPWWPPQPLAAAVSCTHPISMLAGAMLVAAAAAAAAAASNGLGWTAGSEGPGAEKRARLGLGANCSSRSSPVAMAALQAEQEWVNQEWVNLWAIAKVGAGVNLVCSAGQQLLLKLHEQGRDRAAAAQQLCLQQGMPFQGPPRWRTRTLRQLQAPHPEAPGRLGSAFSCQYLTPIIKTKATPAPCRLSALATAAQGCERGLGLHYPCLGLDNGSRLRRLLVLHRV